MSSGHTTRDARLRFSTAVDTTTEPGAVRSTSCARSPRAQTTFMRIQSGWFSSISQPTMWVGDGNGPSLAPNSRQPQDTAPRSGAGAPSKTSRIHFSALSDTASGTEAQNASW